ncbi:MAG: nicotinate phosphoribosyltransferase [Candidatus Korarchaeota archaeon]|nr:nicotinate phosphoribosyltransferase [Thermoproteota archaeon]MCR8472015.1 nicotinate phosphoribosyltransferase [Thermoproteota archaeon]MCR8472974.1 nicotinate phosphoribosyltransferase [Thermoproteota archaeon]MCR8488984.1 nicotinate phosphoribosyltransferase [Thermoproteota archaeon]
MSFDRRFFIASEEDIKSCKVTDIYFIRTKEILERDGFGDVVVAAEFTISSLPNDYKWLVFAGMREVLHLLEGLPVDVYAIPEGTIIPSRDQNNVRIPVMTIIGPYSKFATYETPILGFLAAASGYATKAARLRKKAGSVPIINFGARRIHPAIASVCDFYSYIGGFDAVSNVLGAEILAKKPTGTMPHSLLIVYRVMKGDHAFGWKAFDDYMPPDVPRIMLCDTFSDEVEESIKAVKVIGPDKIYGVRLDTPSSRKGNFAEILKEVKWKLKIEGFERVKVFLSGGINEDNIEELVKAGADGFGIGSAIANAPFIDFAMDIIAVKKNEDWIYISKRGKFSGLKQVWRFIRPDGIKYEVTLREEKPAAEDAEPLLEKWMENGRIIREFPTPDQSRDYVLKQLKYFDL